jgi:hypothetical protein
MHLSNDVDCDCIVLRMSVVGNGMMYTNHFSLLTEM